jgi:FkbM family methyltransferase
MTSYSQNDEQAVVLDFFGDHVGRFIDIGAGDGTTRSNTRALAIRGWQGACVEASPVAFGKLLDLYARNENVQVVNALLSPEGGWRAFYEANGDGISTLSEVHRDKWGTAGAVFRTMQMWAVTPAQLIERIGLDFDFLSLDVEAINVPILRGIMDLMPRFRCVCVEHDDQLDAVGELMARHGFERLMFNGENAIFGR